MIYRYPRYGELFDAWRAGTQRRAARGELRRPQALRDLQVLSQLAWFDEEFLAARSGGPRAGAQGPRTTRSKIRR